MEKTEEECGQKPYENAYVRTSSRTLDVAIPLPTLNPSLRSGGPPINYGVIATGNHFILIRCAAHHTGRNSWTFGLRPTQPGTNSLIGIADNTGNEGFCLKNRCKNFDTARRGHAPALAFYRKRPAKQEFSCL